MKRMTLAAVLTVIILTFASCHVSVEELLEAPLLTQDQRAILACIEGSSAEAVGLKYPAGGDWRTPIQLIDLNSDGAEEAVVFYNVPAEGLNARVAVLGRSGTGWEIKSELEGAGTAINSVQAITLADGGEKYLLMEWSSINTAEQRVAVYNFIDSELRIGLNEACSDMIVADLDDDGMLEFCYITASVQGELFRLKFVDDSDGGLAVLGEIPLNAETVSAVSMLTERNLNGSQTIYVDEFLDSSMSCTELFRMERGILSAVTAGEEYNIPLLTLRAQDARISRQFDDGPVLVPSDVAPRETIADGTLWKYWYAVGADGVSLAMTTYMNANFNINVAVPDRWLETVTVAESETDSRRFIFTEMPEVPSETEEIETGAETESETEPEIPAAENGSEPPEEPDLGTEQTVLMEIKVLTVNDDAKPYEEEGFQMISTRTSGAYRYYIKTNCPPDETRYITDRFYSVTAQ